MVTRAETLLDENLLYQQRETGTNASQRVPSLQDGSGPSHWVRIDADYIFKQLLACTKGLRRTWRTAKSCRN